MQEIINKLVSEAGLTPEQAASAFSVMVQHIKTKVPPAFASSIDQFLGIHADEAATAEKKVNTMEQLRDKAEEFAQAAKEHFDDVAGQAREKLSEAADKAEEMARDAMDKFKEMLKDGNKK